MKETAETINNKCDHCGKVFVRSSSLFKHACEQKRRWDVRDSAAARIAYDAWISFYKTVQLNSKQRSYRDFIASPYYNAFMRYGNYCVNVNVVNVSGYTSYLIKNNVRIDDWDSDIRYSKYLIDYLRNEDGMEAVARSVKHLLSLAEIENLSLRDVFKYTSSNKICHMIITGKVSPWILYKSKEGVNFLESLNDDQRHLIFEYIDPEKWKIKFMRDPENVKQIEQLLKEINRL